MERRGGEDMMRPSQRRRGLWQCGRFGSDLPPFLDHHSLNSSKSTSPLPKKAVKRQRHANERQ